MLFYTYIKTIIFLNIFDKLFLSSLVQTSADNGYYILLNIFHVFAIYFILLLIFNIYLFVFSFCIKNTAYTAVLYIKYEKNKL